MSQQHNNTEILFRMTKNHLHTVNEVNKNIQIRFLIAIENVKNV